MYQSIVLLLVYPGESKVLPYFVCWKHNSAAPDAFAEFVKLNNFIGPWDAKLAWYFVSAIYQIFSMAWSMASKNYGFRSTCFYPIVKFLANQTKFL